MDIRLSWPDGRGYVTGVDRNLLGECLSVGPETFDALVRAGLVEDHGRSRGRIELPEELLRRLGRASDRPEASNGRQG